MTTVAAAGWARGYSQVSRTSFDWHSPAVGPAVLDPSDARPIILFSLQTLCVASYGPVQQHHQGGLQGVVRLGTIHVFLCCRV